MSGNATRARARNLSMTEYERSRLVQASPDDVFAFVSDASNLATFLPTVDAVEPQAEDRVEVHGEVGAGATRMTAGFASMGRAAASSGVPTSARIQDG